MEGSDRPFQMLGFCFSLGQRFSEFIHFSLKTFNDFIVLLDVVFDVLESLLQHLDQLQAFTGDLILVVLHFLETSSMVLHQFISVLILTLLNLVDFNFHA